MNHIRGVLMLIAAGIAFFRGWRFHGGLYAFLAFGLAALALGLAIWHFSRKSDK